MGSRRRVGVSTRPTVALVLARLVFLSGCSLLGGPADTPTDAGTLTPTDTGTPTPMDTERVSRITQIFDTFVVEAL